MKVNIACSVFIIAWLYASAVLRNSHPTRNIRSTASLRASGSSIDKAIGLNTIDRAMVKAQRDGLRRPRADGHGMTAGSVSLTIRFIIPIPVLSAGTARVRTGPSRNARNGSGYPLAEPLIKVQMLGLREFRQNLRAADAALPREVRKVFNEVSKAIRDDASARMPRRSGKLAASVRARSTQTEGRVVAGKGSVPYAGFIEFGGRVGKGRTGPGTGSVSRPYIRSGRYLYPALVRRQDEVKQAMEQALANLAQRLSR